MAKALFLQILFRAYTQFTLAQRISFWSAAVVRSALYMVMIATSASLNVIGLAIVFIVQLFRSRTHRLWFAIAMNAAFDFRCHIPICRTQSRNAIVESPSL
jgi:membrane protease YdiL (CAAX protease family)